METPDYVIVLTTLPAEGDRATAFARALVEDRVAACVNVLPEMRSIYRWKDVIEDEPERQVVIKTSRDRLDQLRERLEALHPYEVPELVVVPVIDGGPAYLDWVRQNTRPG